MMCIKRPQVRMLSSQNEQLMQHGVTGQSRHIEIVKQNINNTRCQACSVTVYAVICFPVEQHWVMTGCAQTRHHVQTPQLDVVENILQAESLMRPSAI